MTPPDSTLVSPQPRGDGGGHSPRLGQGHVSPRTHPARDASPGGGILINPHFCPSSHHRERVLPGLVATDRRVTLSQHLPEPSRLGTRVGPPRKAGVRGVTAAPVPVPLSAADGELHGARALGDILAVGDIRAPGHLHPPLFLLNLPILGTEQNAVLLFNALGKIPEPSAVGLCSPGGSQPGDTGTPRACPGVPTALPGSPELQPS